ncbi:hypothetical protein AB5I39_06580 [Sphingomonas sp. MMS24-J45]|uniref:hypothetical protein n=1 Tax=Sphingomonas sp. MMS24-J45 TaxID=3238806 RepID=UPI00384C4BD8
MRSYRAKAFLPLLFGVVLVGGCASRTAPITVAPVPLPVAAAPTMPAGAYAGMPIPARGADGAYITPNRALSPAATVWHFRAGLNVAALACRGSDDATLVAHYNAVLTSQRDVLRDAEAAVAAEYRAGGGGEWRARYDDAMTSLYNFFSQSFAREAFCATAARTLADSEGVAPTAFAAFAAERLPQLDQAFTDFYRRYDAWRSPQTIAAVASPPPQVATTRIELYNVSALPDPRGQELRASVTPRVIASAQPIR